MQTVIQQMRSSFPPRDIALGEEYAAQGRVLSWSFDDERLAARVKGEKIYSVRLERVIDGAGQSPQWKLKADCTCPRFATNGVCKHLWAASVLAAPKLEAWRPQVTWRNLLRAAAPPPVPRKPANESIYATILERSDRPGWVQFRHYETGFKKNGEVKKPKFFRNLYRSDPVEASFLTTYRTLAGLAAGHSSNHYYYSAVSEHVHEVPVESLKLVLPAILDASQVYASIEDWLESLRSGSESTSPRLRAAVISNLRFKASEADVSVEVSASLEWNGVRIALEELALIDSNLLRRENEIAILNVDEHQQKWLQALRTQTLHIPLDEIGDFAEAVISDGLPFDLPEKLQWREEFVSPTVTIFLVEQPSHLFFEGSLKFQYGSRVVDSDDPRPSLPSADDRCCFVRNFELERSWSDRIPKTLIFSLNGDGRTLIRPCDVASFVQAALEVGFQVNVEGRKLHKSGSFAMSVKSEIDWFEIGARAEFGGMWISYPRLLEAVRRGEKFIPLENGEAGIVDAELQKRIARLDAFSGSDKLRFSRQQSLLVHSLLEDVENIQVDKSFAALRKALLSFGGLKPVKPPATFKGVLRDYQIQGVSWLNFLTEHGLGGILADDMGLGKTIQCLALLDRRRRLVSKPTLLVAPKSLLSNWCSEAAKFTPRLKIYEHAGADRATTAESFREGGVVVMTYQTMIRDFEILNSVDWDGVILDEAQAIKNIDSLSAKAAKAMKAEFRLAMTGTPIENSVRDLISISDFVNPGLINQKLKNRDANPDSETLKILGRAMKPVILRRTKEQVLTELPPKTEQIIRVELGPEQRRAYNELKKFYQHKIGEKIETEGASKAQIQVLAALTRLRQAAIHPGLIDPNRKTESSAKLEAMFALLENVLAENHRVLIFSQFTQLLDIVREQLRVRGIQASYLDGQTRDRKLAVQDFRDGTNQVFLISLKAGGVGLNLVEADYVFLLDPWWNPAVESQAIDRAHRMGQTRPVNAYRFIAADTVEEKIVALQSAKKKIVKDVLDETQWTRGLTAADIKDLLS